MLKKGGQPWLPHGRRGFGSALVGNEALAYGAASESIERDLRQLEKIKGAVEPPRTGSMGAPNRPAQETFRAADGATWHVYAHLVALPGSRILPCQTHENPDRSVIQEFE